MSALSAADLELLTCASCARVARAAPAGASRCPRCGARLRPRKPHSLARSAALLVAAALVFVPANLLPVMTTRTLFKTHTDTILSGVDALWKAGSWPLALIVFVASILVPGLKIAGLALLVVTTGARSTWRRRARTQLYRVIERVGRWSSLDIFVMALLAALVRSPVASVEIKPGAMAFAAVVVLTMLSSMSFDPRLIWDRGRIDRE